MTARISASTFISAPQQGHAMSNNSEFLFFAGIQLSYPSDSLDDFVTCIAS